MPLCEDPRPDLVHDSKDWERLLDLATKEDLQLAWILHGFRCGGLRLQRENNNYSLRPELNPRISEWTNQAEYEKDRTKWLIPHKEKIIKLLDRLNETEVSHEQNKNKKHLQLSLTLTGT